MSKLRLKKKNKKTRPEFLLFGDFSPLSIFSFITCALRKSQEDGCVKKRGKGFLIPLIFTVPSQQETLKAPWVSLAIALDRAACM